MCNRNLLSKKMLWNQKHAACWKSRKAAKWHKLVKRLAEGTNDNMLKVERTVVGELSAIVPK
jgi:hypothetical protein